MTVVLPLLSPSLSDLTLSIREARLADLLLLNDKICRFGRRQSVDSGKKTTRNNVTTRTPSVSQKTIKLKSLSILSLKLIDTLITLFL